MMAASLLFIWTVELITIALMLVLSFSLSLVVAWAILEAVFLFMMRSTVPNSLMKTSHCPWPSSATM
jgi:hypothetical protein